MAPVAASIAARPPAPDTLTVEQVEDNLREIRCLAADLVQQYNGGHPGTAMGAASIGYALWNGLSSSSTSSSAGMRYNAANPTWANRDRFVLSAGHACLLQYIYLHLAGYAAWAMGMLRRYHSPDLRYSIADGHPEINVPAGIEVTTGPLGQGIANSVGLAMASKQLAAQFNRPGFAVVNNKVWCFTGDGCLQEGVGQEALSLAGHLRLDNLILIYDCNAITVDGSISRCFSEDTVSKLRALGWHVLEVAHGSTDVAAINAAFAQARAHRGQPVCVKVDTVIGYGSRKAGSGAAHGAALGEEEVAYVKQQFAQSEGRAKCSLSIKVYDAFERAKMQGKRENEMWDRMLEGYRREYPQLAVEFERRTAQHGQPQAGSGLPEGWRDHLPSKASLPRDPIPTRKASGLIVQALAPRYAQLIGGSADLLDSTFVSWEGMVEFQPKDDDGNNGTGSYAGRQVRYGIREHAMAGIANGLAAYAPHAFIPFISTFFMFFLYAAPATRMAALQRLRVIGIATHDSYTIGEDGPTHQPVELASFYRALPNCNFFRPADAEEVVGAWTIALEAPNMPSLLSLSRQPVPLDQRTDRELVRKGAYVVYELGSTASPLLTLVATGGEVGVAIAAADLLFAQCPLTAQHGVRVVSAPILSLFDQQPRAYRRSVIPTHAGLAVAVEAWSSLPWPRYVGAALCMHTFGHSAPHKELSKMFGFDPPTVANKLQQYVEARVDSATGEVQLPGVGEFEELLLGYVH